MEDAGAWYQRKSEEKSKAADELAVAKAELKRMQDERFAHGDRSSVPADESALYRKVKQLQRAYESAAYVGD